MNHGLRRLAVAAVFAISASGAASAADTGSRTVEEFHDALRVAGGSAKGCAPLVNFARIALTDSVSGFIVSGGGDAPGVTAESAAAVDACISATARPVVVFDDKSGTPLLSPLNMEDPSKVYAAPTMPAAPSTY